MLAWQYYNTLHALVNCSRRRSDGIQMRKTRKTLVKWLHEDRGTEPAGKIRL